MSNVHTPRGCRPGKQAIVLGPVSGSMIVRGTELYYSRNLIICR